MEPVLFWLLFFPGLFLALVVVLYVYFYWIDGPLWAVLGWLLDPLDPIISRVWKWTERLRRW